MDFETAAKQALDKEEASAQAAELEIRGLNRPSPYVLPVDVEQSEGILLNLIRAYQDNLRVVSRFPRLGRRTILTIRSLQPTRERRWVARPFVQIFVESHIRAKLERLIEVLGIETMSLGDADRTKKIEEWSKQLQEMKDKLLGWGRYHVVLTKAPWLSALFPFLGAVLFQLVRIDISGTTAFGSSFTQLLQSGGWRSILLVVKTAALVFLYGYIVIAPFIVAFGFRAKRAIFNAGQTIPIRWFKEPDISENFFWEGMPEVNTYHVENQLFESLGLAKSREFPLDLVLRIVPYYMLGIAISSMLDAVHTLRARHIPWGAGATTLLLLFGEAVFVYSAVAYYKERLNENAL